MMHTHTSEVTTMLVTTAMTMIPTVTVLGPAGGAEQSPPRRWPTVSWLWARSVPSGLDMRQV